MSKKKKILILSVMTILLVATGYLNIKLNNNIVSTSGEATSNESFFATYRTDRTNTRDQELLYLDAIIASETSTSDAKALAENKKVSLIQSMEQELVMEGLIKAKGFEDVIVTNSSNNINVIIKSPELQASEVAQIVSVIKTQTGKSIDNIKIIPINE